MKELFCLVLDIFTLLHKSDSRKYFIPPPLAQVEKEALSGDVSRLEEELSIIAVASRTLTACTVIPIIGELSQTCYHYHVIDVCKCLDTFKTGKLTLN